MNIPDKIKSLRGFREFYPELMYQKRLVLNVMVETVKLFGFKEVDGPSVEPLELFKIKSGDAIVNETFSFNDKGGRSVVLIPEATPTVARMASNILWSTAMPIRWYSNPKLWRYEEPQRGRMREFFQFNVDIIGIKNSYTDAEILSVAYHIIERLGVEESVEIRLSHRELLSSFLPSIDKNKIERLYHLVDRKDKMGSEQFQKELETLLDKGEVAIVNELIAIRMPFKESIDLLEHIPGNENSRNVLNELKELYQVLVHYGIASKIIIDPSIVRGLAYYTGIVFECWDKQKELRAIFGGGRYDKLIQLLSGVEVPAVGFAVGDVTLELLLRKEGKWPAETNRYDIYAIVLYREYLDRAVDLITKLRHKNVSVIFDYQVHTLDRGLRIGSKNGFKFAVIIGREIEGNNVIVKNLDTKEQMTISIDDLMTYFRP